MGIDAGAVEQDRSLRAPCAVRARGRVADHARRAAAGGDLLELSARDEAEEPAVGRPERPARAFRARERLRLERREGRIQMRLVPSSRWRCRQGSFRPGRCAANPATGPTTTGVASKRIVAGAGGGNPKCSTASAIVPRRVRRPGATPAARAACAARPPARARRAATRLRPASAVAGRRRARSGCARRDPSRGTRARRDRGPAASAPAIPRSGAAGPS
jgi:hypothetical protein